MSSTIIYKPDSLLRSPRQLFYTIRKQFRGAYELSRALTIRDFKVQYRNSLAGYLWAFLPPLVAAFSFILLHSGGVLQIKDTTIPYPAFALIGTILWQIFADSLMNPIKTITSCQSMLTKINFPYEALVLSPIQMSVITLLIRLVILIPCMLWFHFPLAWGLAFAPIGLLFLILLGTAIGLLLAPFSGLYKDVQMGLAMCLPLWMFLTPVVYPTVKDGVIGFIINANPVTHVIGITRDCLTGMDYSQHLAGFIIVAILVLISLLLSTVLFRILMSRVIERMGH